MPYYTHTVAPHPVDARHPLGITVISNEHATLAEALEAPGTTGDVFCDEITMGATSIRLADGTWVNDYANPARKVSLVKRY